MTKHTQKQLKEMVQNGMAIDMTHATKREEIAESYIQVGFATSIYGCGGMLLKGRETGQLYAVVGRVQAIYLF